VEASVSPVSDDPLGPRPFRSSALDFASVR
jgi:hypothetical protein